MNKLKIQLYTHRMLFLVLGIFLVGAGVVYAFSGNSQQEVNIENVEVFNEASVTVEQELGAFPGPELNTPFLSVNGVLSNYERQRMKLGTTTLCSFQNGGATTTLDRFSYNIPISTSVAAHLVLATSTLFAATSTIDALISDRVVVADRKDSASWVGGDASQAPLNNNILAPNIFVLLLTAQPETASNGYYFIGGNCSLTTTEL
ncbi:MAG: hypothetical protein IH948_02855 [Bacteroidetes bacterium]|nr:hypothetical protein [Bacteroidota bacterium]